MIKIKFKVRDKESLFFGQEVNVLHILYRDELHDRIVFECEPIGSQKVFEELQLEIELYDDATEISCIPDSKLASAVRRYLAAEPTEEIEEWQAASELMAKLAGVQDE